MERYENCHVERLEKPFDQKIEKKLSAAYLLVGGMGCPNCAERVRNSLYQLDGVYVAEVDLEQGLAAAVYDPAMVAVDDLIRTVVKSGNNENHSYSARLMKKIPS